MSSGLSQGYHTPIEDETGTLLEVGLSKTTFLLSKTTLWTLAPSGLVGKTTVSFQKARRST